MDLYNDEDLGLDDVEYFKEFLKFKKTRALQKAKAAEVELDVEKKVDGAIEAGTNPPPPGTSPELHMNPSPPAYVPLPTSQNDQENGNAWTREEIVAPLLPIYEPAPPKLAPDTQPSFAEHGSHKDERSSVKERDRERGRSDRNRDHQDPRSRQRYRSRSRDRDPWRQQRRSRSRDRRESRERFESRGRYDARYQSRRRSGSSPRQSEQRPTNFNYSTPVVPHVPMDQLHPASTATSIMPEWNSMAPAQHSQQWEPHVPYQVSAEEQARKLALEKEAQQQKDTFIAQRREYLKKRENFMIELGLLKTQRRELSTSSKLPEVQKIITGNIKLQEEISSKIKSVDSVLDMLKGLIGDDGGDPKPPTPPSPDRASDKDGKKTKKRKRSRSGSSNSDGKQVERRSRSRKRDEIRDRSDGKNREKDMGRRNTREDDSQHRQKFNWVFYDPEVHWCRPCNAFPATAKEYLLHLHSNEHKQTTQDRKLNDLPWHELSEHKEQVVISGLETKRCPIKGLQFFEASTAWFCKLCQTWMGDLHCASLHLKSEPHNKKYEEFSMSNPKWEATWLSDRGKSVVSSGKKEDILKRQLEEQLLLQKKHEEELKQSLATASGLVMPLNLLTKPAPKIKEKSKKKKKDNKKGKKKKRAHSSASSDSSSSSSSSSSGSEDEKLSKKKKKDKKNKSSKSSVPQKSKWEKEDSEDERLRQGPTPEQNSHPIIDARRVRNYRWAENLSRPTRPASPPHVPEKHTILIPESTKSIEVTKSVGMPSRAPPPATNQSQVSSIRVRNRERDIPGDDGESRFDKEAQASAKKKLQQQQSGGSKTKFAFIGRMPFAKRRNDQVEEKPGKEQDVATPDPTPPPPPVISQKVVAPVPPPTPVLTNKTKVEVAKEILTKSHNNYQRQEARPMDPVLMEVDMDIDKHSPSPPLIELPPSPPRIRPALPPQVTTNFGKKMMAVPLPKDFQEALSIIYPEQAPPITTPPLPPAPPAAEIPSPPPPVATPPPPLPPQLHPIQPPSPAHSMEENNKMADYDDFDEMALLGIDKEDMAAQRF